MFKNIISKYIYISCIIILFTGSALAQTRINAANSSLNALPYEEVMFLASNDWHFVYELAEQSKRYVRKFKFDGSDLELRQGLALWLKRNPEAAAIIYFNIATKNKNKEFDDIQRAILRSDLFEQVKGFNLRQLSEFFETASNFDLATHESLHLHEMLIVLKAKVKELTNVLNNNANINRASVIIEETEKMLTQFDLATMKYINKQLSRKEINEYNILKQTILGKIGTLYANVKMAGIDLLNKDIGKRNNALKKIRGIAKNISAKYSDLSSNLQQQGLFIADQYDKVNQIIEEDAIFPDEISFILRLVEDSENNWLDKVYIYENLPSVVKILADIKNPRFIDEVSVFIYDKFKYNQEYLLKLVDISRYRQFTSQLLNLVVNDNFEPAFEMLSSISVYNTSRSGMQILYSEVKDTAKRVNEVREANIFISRLMFGILFYSPADEISGYLRTFIPVNPPEKK